MKDLGVKHWLKIQSYFTEGLGAERVQGDNKRIKLQFDLSDEKQLEQLNRLGNMAVDQKIFFPSQLCGEMKVEIIIPREMDIQKLYPVANSMAVRVFDIENGERHRPITVEEPEHVLEDLTGVKWRHVYNSPYCGHVVEAVLPHEVDGDSRKKQEFGIGYTLNANNVTLNVRDWIEHQMDVEKAHALKPRTLIPGDWVGKSRIQHAERLSSERLVGASLQGIFK